MFFIFVIDTSVKLNRQMHLAKYEEWVDRTCRHAIHILLRNREISPSTTQRFTSQ